MPVDGVDMDTPATCDPDTAGVTSELGRRAVTPLSSDLAVTTEPVSNGMDPVVKWVESVDKWEELVAKWAGFGNAPATTTTILPSDGSTFISLPVVVTVTASVAGAVDCPMPQ